MVTEQQKQSAMRRKTQAGRALHQARTVSILKALRLTLSKVGNDLFALPLATLGATQNEVDGDTCADLIEDTWLLIHLDGPNGTRGGMMIDPGLVGGLIQQQTMGKVTAPLPGPDRAMTSTDAALVAPLIDALLTRAAGLPETEADRAMIDGYRFGARAKDSRLLGLALEASRYHVIRLIIDMAQGARQGDILMCLPVPQPAADTPPDPGEGDAVDTPPRPACTLARTVLSLQADLLVSLAQLTLPLGKVSTLAVGQVLNLGPVSFGNAQLRTRDGRVLATGALGQVSGMRAIRLIQRAKPSEKPQRRDSDAGIIAASRPEHGAFEDIYTVEGLVAEGADPPPGLAGPADARRDGTHKEDGTDKMPDLSDLPGFEEDQDDTRLEGFRPAGMVQRAG